ncbi:MAG: hypothetical protein EKK45_02950 [Curvibacter sp.]|nr:MAG: hypothetical protein EKK45_02950 [Curvibacter sp.]
MSIVTTVQNRTLTTLVRGEAAQAPLPEHRELMEDKRGAGSICRARPDWRAKQQTPFERKDPATQRKIIGIFHILIVFLIYVLSIWSVGQAVIRA